MSEKEQAWYALDKEQVVQRLETDVDAGLETAEAKRRLSEYGYNELEEKPPTTFWERLLDQLKGFVVIILLVAAVISAALGDWIEAGVILAIVVLNAAIGVIQESKAEEALAALKKMAAPDAHVLRGGHRVTIPARELVPGDVVVLEAGSIVPADLRLVESANLKIEEASLTGESVPVNKRAELTLESDAGLGDRRNMAFMSTTVTYGRAKGVVAATGMQTEMGHIAEMIQSVEEEQTPLQRKLDEVGKALGVGSLVICGLVFLVSLLRPLIVTGMMPTGEEIAEFFMIAVSLAIAAVPEGLPAVVTICLALGMQEMVKRHALIRRLPAVETLGSATVICSDKTGTLTQNQMTVTRIWTDGRSYHITGKGYTPTGKFELNGDAIEVAKHKTLQHVLWGSALEEGEGQYRMVGDPTEGSMVVTAAKAGYWRSELEEKFPRIGEAPFDSERKRMSTIHENPGPFGIEETDYVAVVKGAPDLVLERCVSMETASGEIVEMDEARREAISEANIEMASQALRVLAVAYRPIDEVPDEPQPEVIEQDLIFAGLIGMIDPARPEVVPAVRKAQGAGLRTVMVTGDYAATAAAIAKEIGILRPNRRVVSGAELERMDDAQLQEIIDEVDVFARVAPHHKVRIVSALRARNNVVAMTGDGVNDAPALKRADIGVAMGITGTDVSKQTADMVLTDDNYVSIVSAIEQGRVIYSNIRKFVYFLLSCNMAEIAILFIAALVGWDVPLTAIQLLWLNLLSDGAPALALGLEKGDPDIMERPPRPPDEPVINREMIGGVVVQTIAITVAVLWAYSRGHTFAAAAGTDPVRTAKTLAFVTLVLSELFRAYTSRSERYPLLKLGVFSNKYMQYAVGFSVVLLMLVVYVPFLQPIFDTEHLNLQEWSLILPLTLIPSVIAELHKAVVRRLDRR
ncbi:MAG: calcium-translocating P-type ATPase, PMCA-type [Chloroflexi bacterium]|jgi:Ca2+-transporting ATPase|nr:calcium-translocating P-type ATPase, PMCA-type [Chloroflexota bacterium]